MLRVMYRRRFENTTFTRWDVMTDKIKAAPPGGDQPERSEVQSGFRNLRKRDSYEPLWIEVRYRGGPEASWLIRARGRTYRYPGHLCLHDVLAEVAF
jgi:hypothetical protein